MDPAIWVWQKRDRSLCGANRTLTLIAGNTTEMMPAIRDGGLRIGSHRMGAKSVVIPVLLMMLAAAPGLVAENQNLFAGDPKAAKLGEFQFRINCAFCHGLGAHGGGRGP